MAAAAWRSAHISGSGVAYGAKKIGKISRHSGTCGGICCCENIIAQHIESGIAAAAKHGVAKAYSSSIRQHRGGDGVSIGSMAKKNINM